MLDFLLRLFWILFAPLLLVGALDLESISIARSPVCQCPCNMKGGEPTAYPRHPSRYRHQQLAPCPLSGLLAISNGGIRRSLAAQTVSILHLGLWDILGLRLCSQLQELGSKSLCSRRLDWSEDILLEPLVVVFPRAGSCALGHLGYQSVDRSV